MFEYRQIKPTSVKINKLRPLVLAVSIGIASLTPKVSHAFTYAAENTNDSGLHSLRSAIHEANANPGHDYIIFPYSMIGATINLESELLITDSITIRGPTAFQDTRGITINAGGNSRHINAGFFPENSDQFVTLEDVTLTNGHFDGSSYDQFGYGGGSIFIRNANLTLINCKITNNSTSGGNYGHGGGIFVKDGDVTISKTTVSGNSTSALKADGGGLFFFNTSPEIEYDIEVIESTLSDNSTSGQNSTAGGIWISRGNLLLNQSTISGNSTSGSNAYGGGLVVGNNSTNIIQSTITNNSSNFGAGGISALHTQGSNDQITLVNSILSNNIGPQGNLNNILDHNANKVFSNNSLFGDQESEITETNIDNIFSNNPDLGPLQDNGGRTFTHLPNITSPTINMGSNIDIPSDGDQRGDGFEGALKKGASFSRILNGKVDIGSVEAQVQSTTKEVVKRAEIVKPILLALYGNNFYPYTATGNEYTDVAVGDFNANWIERFKNAGIGSHTEGCDIDKFCPNASITKAELAKIILKAEIGIGYTPKPATGIFTDVPIGSFNADWIEALSLNGYTEGCATGKFCPDELVTVEVFNNILNKAFP